MANEIEISVLFRQDWQLRMAEDSAAHKGRKRQQTPMGDPMELDDSNAVEDSDGENGDELDVLRRLSNNYRRYSEQHRLHDSTDEEQSPDVNMQEQSVNDDYVYTDDQEEEDDNDSNSQGEYHDDWDQPNELSERMQMIASAFFGGRERLQQNNDQVHGGNTTERMMMNSLFRQMTPIGPTDNRITQLVNALHTQDDPFLVLETLNEISTALLMMNSIVSERAVSTFNTTKILIEILDRFPEDMEIQLVACRCIYNLAEINFYSMEEIVSAGAVEKLNSMMSDISYMELAEQALQTLEIISRKCGNSLMSRHSIPAVIMYLDFFTIHSQRKVLKIVACASASIRHGSIEDIRNAFLTIQNVALNYSDEVCVESAWIFICNAIHWSQNTKSDLIALANDDLLKGMSKVVVSKLTTSSDHHSHPPVSSKTQLRVSNSLFLMSSNIPKISLALLKDCDLVGSFAKSLNNDPSKIDSILSFPKVPFFAYLKLVASCLPSTLKCESSSENLGQYYNDNTDEAFNSLQEEKMLLFKEENNISNFYFDFASEFFPILLEIFSSSVDFKQKRLVLVIIIRIITFLNSEDLEFIVLNSKLIQTIAPSVRKGQHLLSNSEFNFIPTKSKCILYGCLIISHILVSSSNTRFLSKFKREGLIDHFNELNSLLERVPASQLAICSFEANEELSETDEFDDENDSDEFDEEENIYQEASDRETPIPKSTVSEALSSSKLAVDYSLVNDGNFPTSQECWLSGLSSITKEISSDYVLYSSEESQSKPANILLLEEIIQSLDGILSADSLVPDDQWNQIWHKLASSISIDDDKRDLSSHELVSCGIVIKLANVLERFPNARETFAPIFCLFGQSHDNNLPFIKLINLLNESMNRSEAFEMVTSDLISADTNTRFKAQSIKKQMKLRIEIHSSVDENSDEEDSDSEKKLVIMVQAIATFASLDSFIKRNLLRFSTTRDADQTNCYYEFFINNELVPLDTTVFGACYKLMKDEVGNKVTISSVFNAPMMTIVAKKRIGVRETLDLPIGYYNENHVPNFTDEHTMSVLKLMSVLHSINVNTKKSDINNSLFLNSKLTAKLNRQLDEPLVVASGILPEWALYLPRHYSFIFPLDTRIFFMKSTSFGYARLMSLWAGRSKEEDGNSLTTSLGRSVRHKLRIARSTMFLGAMKIMQNFASKPGLIEIEYYEEAGSGLGPTLEFYANVSKDFSRTKLFMWRANSYGKLKAMLKESENNEIPDEYIYDPNGLFPRPLPKELGEKSVAKIEALFQFLGRFLARSFLDSRIVDFRFNPAFFKLAIDTSLKQRSLENLSMNEKLELLKKVDPSLANSLLQLISFSKEEQGDEKISSLSLSYVLPGYSDCTLKQKGETVDITRTNLNEYIEDVINSTLGEGISTQLNAFVSGFNEVFPFSALMLFTADEFLRLTGNEKEDWSVSTILSAIHADHGYTLDSMQIQWLVNIMTSFDDERKRRFLQFLTGSPRLPIGGFKSLAPPLTVVLKHADEGFKGDDYLPSVMTCANYLKLPQYSSAEIMEFKLVHAMEEGANSFLLS